MEWRRSDTGGVPEELETGDCGGVRPKPTTVEKRLGNDTRRGGGETFESDGELCGVEGGVGALLSDISILRIGSWLQSLCLGLVGGDDGSS